MPVIANVLVCAALLATGETNQALIMIENPEAHLHPAGQTKMGEFLTRAAACGVQCVVETHSDHLLNGMRIAEKWASSGQGYRLLFGQGCFGPGEWDPQTDYAQRLGDQGVYWRCPGVTPCLAGFYKKGQSDERVQNKAIARPGSGPGTGYPNDYRNEGRIR